MSTHSPASCFAPWAVPMAPHCQQDLLSPAQALSRVPGGEVMLDALERNVLFLDTLRQRGNTYVDHVNAGEPPLLKFDHELVLDGRNLPRRCNYTLIQLTPLAEHPIDPALPPVVVVDPRAGHGPGIGGFKQDSEIGVALRAGHPTYFVSFRPQPEEGQTLADIMAAEARFLEVVAERHPAPAPKPVVIGNCQAGWAIALLAASRPELFGTTVLVGSPLSYWAGSSRMNPMRYSGAMLGGAWLSSMTADLSSDRFDGAHLVQNFENLNPAHAFWSKYHHLWANVDSEAERFLDFERWWGGYFRMTGAEIETIVENLFVGNRLARGEMEIDGLPVDLRNITQPVVVFASWGDNITPPPQALDWIIDTWGDEKAIAAAGRTIVYVLHEHIGHLGIFVGGEIARKEHDQIVGSMDAIAALPPGLYEMRVERKDGRNVERWDELEPGSYTVEFDRRTMDDLRELNPEGRDEEQIFSTVAQLSEINSAIYKTWVRPVLKPIASRLLADGLTHAHPLRWQRQWLSDVLPGATVLEQWAERIRADRHALPKQHPAHLFDAEISRLIESGLDLYRDLRDQAVVGWTRLAFGPLGLGAFLLPKPSDAARAAERAAGDLARHRHEVMPHLAEGGFARAVCRIVLAGMQEQGGFERRSLRLAQLLTHLAPHAGEAAAADSTDSTDATDWAELVREEARVLAVAPLDALNAVIEMLPTPDLRERALAVAAAVLMIHPSEQSPQYDVVRRLMVYLGARPRRVYELAQALVQPIEAALQGEVAQEGAITAPVAVKAAKRVRQATAQAADVARPAAKKPVVTKAGATKAGATKAATRKATTVKAAAEPAAAVTAPAKKAPKKAPEGATKDALKQAPKQAPKEAAPAKKPAAKKSAPAA